MSDKLTLKQKAFIDKFIQTGNATQSAIHAGYSRRTAAVIGAENLTKPNIKAYYEKRIEILELATLMQQKEVLQRLTRIARREEKESVVVTLKNRRSSYDINGKKVIEEVEEPMIIEIPTRLQDTNKSLELLGKHFGMYVEKVEEKVDMQIKIEIDYGDEVEDK